MVRLLEFNEAWHPNSQRYLRDLKGKESQLLWIACACGDTSFSLSVHLQGDVPFVSRDQPYRRLWSVLAKIDFLAGRKAWLIGWRMRYALERANFLRALDRGEVALPRHKKGKNEGKHTGKLTMSSRVLEVDVELGKNKIKILDWQNFGVEPAGYVDGSRGITLADAERVLRDYLAAAKEAGMQVSRTTAAQVGWAHARQTGLAGPLHCNLDLVSRRLERAAYHGGRCEAFRLGEIPGTTYSLDVASCYARICRERHLPCQLVEEYRAGCDVEMLHTEMDQQWIADVVVKTDQPDYPLRWGKTPIFPIGQFRTTLPWPELWHALNKGRVVKVLRAARYATAPVLRDYAAWYLRCRERLARQKTRLGAGWLKAVFNSSLGYSAREKYEWQPWDVEIPWQYWIGVARSPEDDDSAVQVQKLSDETRWLRVAGEPRESVPFLHATICSYARLALLEIFETAGRENVLYCDTDGVLATKAGADNLRSSQGRGDRFRFGLVERFAPGSARILGQKTYSVGGNVIAAGVVGARNSKTLGKVVLETPTGRVDSEGRVHPFEFRCEDSGDILEKWVNKMV